jgi:hypothetical protein
MEVSKSIYDNVHKPSHYTEGRKYEPKDVIRDWGLDFNLGSAVKYIARAGRKDDIVQDLKKAKEFIQFEIDAIEAEREQAVKPKSDDTDGVMLIKAPIGMPPEEIIHFVINKVYGGI